MPGNLSDGLRRDLAYAARSLRRTPGFTTAAVLVLAVGIGMATAVFTLAGAWALLLGGGLAATCPRGGRCVWIRWRHCGTNSTNGRGRPDGTVRPFGILDCAQSAVWIRPAAGGVRCAVALVSNVYRKFVKPTS